MEWWCASNCVGINGNLLYLYVSSMSPTIQMGQYDCKCRCPAHLLHPTEREHRSWHSRQVQPLVPVYISLPWHEMLPQLPQDPPSQAISPPPHVHTFSNRVSFFTKCSLHSSNYTTCLGWAGPSTGMCAPVWGSEVIPSKSKTWVWQALKGSGPEVCWWNARYSGIVCKREKSYWMVITSETLIESLKVYEMKDLRIPVFNLYW